MKFLYGQIAGGHDLVPVVLQPLVFFIIVRADSQHFPVETGGVVHDLSVAELVYDDGIDDVRRGQHEKRVESQASVSLAAAPF